MRTTAGVTAALILCSIGALSAQQWPSFRGDGARGVADTSPPVAWDAKSGDGIRWHVPIAGLSHASPIVWNGRVFVISALAAGSTLDRTAEGVVFATDTVSHEWQLHCLDAASGAVRWTRTIHVGTPRQPRHVRGTYANATPATNGRVIVASLGNEGLFAFDVDGSQLWRVEMAPEPAGASLDPASSPVITGDLAIVQNDWLQGGFAAAYDLQTGREVWRVARSESLSWSTPGLWSMPDGTTQVVFNSRQWIRAHDASNGREIWRLNNAVETPWDRVPTPYASGDLLMVGGGGSQGPLMAVRATASGELQQDPAVSPAVAWRIERGAPYLPTPLSYADAGTISASPVAAGGRIYVSSQDGDIFVVRAGETFELLSRNPMGEPIFATPAIAGDLLIVRTAAGVYGVGSR